MHDRQHSTIERSRRNKRSKNGFYTVTPIPASSSMINSIPPPHVHSQQQQQQQYQYINLPGTLTSLYQQHQHPTIQQQQPIDDRNSIDQNNGLIIFPQQQQQQQSDFNPVEFIEQQQGQQQQQIVRWNRNDSCTPCNCLCFFIAFLLLIMALMSERVFKVKFIVRNQDYLRNELENVDSDEFRQFSNLLRKQIDSLFQQSIISRSFVKTDIIAFERKRNSPSETIIHLNVHIAADKSTNVETSDIYLIFAEEIVNNRLKIFENLMADHNSIDVQERRWHPFYHSGENEKYSVGGNPWNHKSLFPGMLEGLRTDPTPPPRKCTRIDLQYCRFLPYNQTSYPNFFNHWNISSIEDEFIQFKELIDSECYSLSKHFICSLLQPECHNNNNDDEMFILPCRNFCQEFYHSCHRWLPEKLMRKISCSTFPATKTTTTTDDNRNIFIVDDEQENSRNRNGGKCHEKPDCATQLRLQSQHYKICDGIFDCLDNSDESNCTYCSITNNDAAEQQFHCGDRQCISLNQTCDNIRDCRNGADEINCLRLISSDKLPGKKSRITKMTTSSIMNEGYLVAISRGKHSYVCNDDHSTIYNSNQTNGYYNNNYDNHHNDNLGRNICEENYFE
ncbi:atrial natriuretic peptide-converting enzyme-like protein [Euroglyphus maynei]|uniref:Atrial natriuretic peptide-converting enzyme-like protein n=1 Tax=Euroglyphus maynei TaxID=6958 RepID=A0A1Y3BN37_EURMA|nr:atrial natriuretic peptide-converting enzyme-like protein [Euroglyphus maynei]